MTTKRMVFANRHVGRILGLALITLSLNGCERDRIDSGDARPDRTAIVATTAYPLKFFAEQIGGNDFQVVYPLESDGQSDSASWRPSSVAVTAMQKADRVLTNGAGFESWLKMVSLSDASVVDTSRSFQDRLVPTSETVVHQHGPEGEHSHREVASHTWLNPELAILQAEQIAEALGRLRPELQADIQRNFQGLEQQLRDLRQSLLDLGPQLVQSNLIVAADIYQYLEQATGASFQRIIMDPQSDPSAEQWQQLDAWVSAHGDSVLLWPVAPAAALQQSLQERGIKSVLFDPLANAPSQGDFLSGMQDNIRRLADACR